MKKPIVILAALNAEQQYYLQEIDSENEYRIGDYVFIEGKYHGKDIVIGNCLIGKIYAAVAASIAITKYQPSMIISQGTAGAHDPELEPGDIVIVDKMMDLDRAVRVKENAGNGTDCSTWIYPEKEIYEENGYEYVYSAHSNKHLMEIAKTINNEYGRSIIGNAGCSDAWNKEKEDILFYHNELGTDCEEMEGYAISKICEQFSIPSINIRIISNSAFKDDLGIKDVEYDKFGKHCQEFVLKLVDKL